MCSCAPVTILAEMPRWIRILARSAVCFATALLVAYAADSLVFRLRAAPFGAVTVRPYLAVPKKDGRTEFMFEGSRDQSCVKTLFPHASEPPCWYLRRHSEQRINI